MGRIRRTIAEISGVEPKCYACGTAESKPWYYNLTTDGMLLMLCRHCYSNIITNPNRSKETIQLSNKKRMWFKGKMIRLQENPRKGTCSRCGKHVGEVKKTSMHHEKYDETDPLKDTQELCDSCHAKRSHELNQMDKSGLALGPAASKEKWMCSNLQV